MTQLPKSSPLSGADWFMLAMDDHMTRHKTVGNICRYALFLDGRIDGNILREALDQKIVINWLSRLKIKHRAPFIIPTWEHCKTENFAEVVTWESDTNSIPDLLFKRDILISDGPLFNIDIVNLPPNKSIFIFSWHHILMDGRGAGILLKYLNGEIDLSDSSKLVSLPTVKRGFRKNINNMIETKNFLKESSRKPLASLLQNKIIKNPECKQLIIKFNTEEVQIINQNATKHGAKFGIGAFYLAATTRGIHAIQTQRGEAVSPYWIPVPQDERLRGSFGPVITNQLSFIFYRIPVKCLSSIKETVTEITSQMVEQIKAGTPRNYGHMMDWFRRLPLKPYYRLIKGPAGGSIASFLFSVAADSPQELRNFFGLKIEDAVNYPPNTYPPGLTIVFMRFNGTLKIIISYVEQVVSKEEIHLFEKMVRSDLLKGDLKDD